LPYLLRSLPHHYSLPTNNPTSFKRKSLMNSGTEFKKMFGRKQAGSKREEGGTAQGA
jgi:hypothetical protein